MKGVWSESPEERRRWKLFNGKQEDPTQKFKRSGTPYFRRGRDRVLMPDDFMPIGHHAGKHLRAVPPEYLLWVDTQAWSKQWTPWEPVHDYIERFILSDPETAVAIEVPQHSVLFVDKLRIHETKIQCFKAGSAHLHTLPGHEDLLHAFVVGALHLSRDWYQPGRLPHYDLTVGKHAQALRLGVVLIEDQQLIAHKDAWLQFFRSKPQPTPHP